MNRKKQSSAIKVRVLMPVSVHPFKAKIWDGIQRGRIKTGMTLRAIAEAIGHPSENPQKIKHHLQAMVAMGTIDYVKGQYKLENCNGRPETLQTN